LVDPIIHGGGQSRLRSGTENVPAIVGFAKALELNAKEKKRENARLKKLRDKLEKGIFAKIPKVILNGHQTERLANFLNVSILDVEGEAMLLNEKFKLCQRLFIISKNFFMGVDIRLV
jgi:cysteine desulfurase